MSEAFSPFNVGTFPATRDLIKASVSLHPHSRGLTGALCLCPASNREPIVVTVTGAAGQIAYSLLFSLGKGDVFGPDQPVGAPVVSSHMLLSSLHVLLSTRC